MAKPHASVLIAISR